MTHTKFLILFFISIHTIFSVEIFAQKGYDGVKNMVNSEKKKDGYWIEENAFGKSELYYKNGVRNGVFKVYNRKGDLAAFGEYKDGQYTGQLYSFGNDGHLLAIQCDFKTNSMSIKLDNGDIHVYKNQNYTKQFYSNGTIQSEGLWLWDDDIELDTNMQYGKWIFYDEKGRKIKEVIYE